VKECYPLDVQVASNVRKVIWLLHPAHRELPAFLHQLRDTLNAQVGDTRVEFASSSKTASPRSPRRARRSRGSSTRPPSSNSAPTPPFAGVQLETKRLELKTRPSLVEAKLN